MVVTLVRNLPQRGIYRKTARPAEIQKAPPIVVLEVALVIEVLTEGILDVIVTLTKTSIDDLDNRDVHPIYLSKCLWYSSNHLPACSKDALFEFTLTLSVHWNGQMSTLSPSTLIMGCLDTPQKILMD